MIVFTAPNLYIIPDKELKRIVWTEYRLDLYEDWTTKDFSRLHQKSILTCRGPKLTPELLQSMLDCRSLIDLDLAQWEEHQGAVPAERLILSLHLESFDEEKIRSFLSHPQAAKYYKLILKTERFADIVRTKALIEEAKREIVFNVLGRWALLQRSLCNIFGSIGFYAAYDHSLNTAQPLFSDVLPIWLLNHKRVKHAYAIIGSERVNMSATVKVYNHASEGLDESYVMLPIPAKNLEEVHEVLSFLKGYFFLAGLVITNPFKKQFATFLKCRQSIINTVQFSETKHLYNVYNPDLDTYVYTKNTDLVAFREALHELDIKPPQRVLIYGSGDCAEAFARELKLRAYKSCFIMGRNAERVKQVKDQFQLLDPDGEPYGLLVNTTPLGLNNTDDISHIPKFNKLIDLSYSYDDTPLLTKLAKEQNLPVFDGFQFWKKQFRKQFECFLYSEENEIDMINSD